MNEKKRKLRDAVAIMIFMGILVLPITVIPLVKAQEGVIILNPIDDAYTDGSRSNSNYGSELKLKTLGWYLTWLKFNLSTIPEGAFGFTAILELYTTLDGITKPHDVVARLILDNSWWTEETITAHNCPNYITSIELDIDYVANDETWYEWIVTEAIMNATANNTTTVTILVRCPYGPQPSTTISFTSKEASLTKQPKLTIFWEGIIPEFPSFLILPLSMIATLGIVIMHTMRTHKMLEKKKEVSK